MEDLVRTLIVGIAQVGDGAKRGHASVRVEELARATKLTANEIEDAADLAEQFLDPAKCRKPMRGWLLVGLNALGRQFAFEHGVGIRSPRSDASTLLEYLRRNEKVGRDALVHSDTLLPGGDEAWPWACLVDAADTLENEGFVTVERIQGTRFLLRPLAKARSAERLYGNERAQTGAQLDVGAVLVGKTGTYRLERRIGDGGTARVYEVSDDAGNRYAAKVLSGHRFEIDAYALKRFAREVSIQQTLNHPGLVRVHDVADHDGVPVPVMELVGGGSLHARMSVFSADSPSMHVRLQWMNRLVEALAHVHEQKLVHRDITPKNILFRVTNEPVLADFGTVRRIDDATITRDHEHLGSLIYISAQQRQDPHAADATDDIFSLGQVFYGLVVGSSPHGNAPSLVALADGTVSRDERSPPFGPEGCPAIIAGLIDAMRAHRRKDRPPLEMVKAILGQLLDALRGMNGAWASLYLDAMQITTPELRSICVGHLPSASVGEREALTIVVAGLYDALRIWHARSERKLRGNRADEFEDRLPSRHSQAANALFPMAPLLYRDPVLADDEDGEESIRSLAFGDEARRVFYAADEWVLKHHSMKLPFPPSAEELITGTRALVQRIRELERTSATLIAEMAELIRTSHPSS